MGCGAASSARYVEEEPAKDEYIAPGEKGYVQLKQSKSMMSELSRPGTPIESCKSAPSYKSTESLLSATEPRTNKDQNIYKTKAVSSHQTPKAPTAEVVAAALQKKYVKVHQKQCKTFDLHMFHKIRDAYPFDPEKKKTVKTEERICGLDHKSKNWGQQQISVLERPQKVTCIICDEFIVSGQDEATFFLCKSCQSSGRRLHLCVQCYEAGYILTSVEGELFKENQEHQRRVHDAKLHKETLSTGQPNCSPSESPIVSRHSSKEKPAAISTEMASGLWHGSYTENKHPRTEERNLTFWDDGNVRGDSPKDGSVLSGVYSVGGKISWTETADWGWTKIDAKCQKNKIVGSFKTSDGGQGKVELRPPQ